MILFFLGREHHAEKMIDLATAFGNVTFLVADNAINIDPPSMFTGKYDLKNTVYLSSYFSENRKEVIEYENIPEDIKKCVSPFWVMYSMEEASRTVDSFENCLNSLKPEAVFVLHLNNFWASQLAQIARGMHIPVFALQEGIILDREVSISGKYKMATQYANFAYSWSASDKNKYTEKNKVIPAGAPHLVKWLNKPKKENRFAFVPPRLDLYKGNVLEDLRLMCNRVDIIPGAELFVKFHPYNNVSEDILKPYAKCSAWKGNVYELLSSSRRTITQISTIAIESIALGSETVIVDTEYAGVGNNMPCPTVHDARNVFDKLDFSEQEHWLSENDMLKDGLAIDRIIAYTYEWIDKLYSANARPERYSLVAPERTQ